METTRFRRRRPLLLLLALAACGCGKDDADGLARIAGLTLARLDHLSGGGRSRLGDSCEAVRGCWSDGAPAARVAVRLRWDKALAGLAVEVKDGPPGTVRLCGSVPDQAAHDRLIEVAQATTGVEQVVDELKIGPTPEAVPEAR